MTSFRWGVVGIIPPVRRPASRLFMLLHQRPVVEALVAFLLVWGMATGFYHKAKTVGESWRYRKPQPAVSHERIQAIRE